MACCFVCTETGGFCPISTLAALLVPGQALRTIRDT